MEQSGEIAWRHAQHCYFIDEAETLESALNYMMNAYQTSPSPQISNDIVRCLSALSNHPDISGCANNNFERLLNTWSWIHQERN